MILTKQRLIDNKAYKTIIDYYESIGCPNNVVDCLQRCIDDNRYSYANWFISHILTHQNKVKYAIHAAEMVLHLFETKYPNNTSVRDAIEEAKKFGTKEFDRKRCASAASAAYASSASAAYAAATDAYVAYAAAAASAAYVAAYVADTSSAAYASYVAEAAYASDAAYAAAAVYAVASAAVYEYGKTHNDIYLQWLQYGIELYKTQD